MIKLKNWRTYFILCIMECLQRINNLALFVIPLQAISSIARGKIASRIGNILKIFEVFNLPAATNENLYQYFVFMIIFTLFSLLTVRHLKNVFLIRIKKRALNRIKKINGINEKTVGEILQEFREIERFSRLIGEIVFICILITFICLFDFQLFVIILFGTFIYWQAYLYFYKKKLAEDDATSQNSDDENDDNDDNDGLTMVAINNELKNNKDPQKRIKKLITPPDLICDETLRPIVVTLVMLVILTSIYFRTNSSFNIVVIFLVRRFLTTTFSSIKTVVQKTAKI